MKKVLVLPFHVQKTLKNHEYLSEGILEELIDLVSLSPGMRATSRSISLYLGKNPTPGIEISERFGVNYIIEGSVKSISDKTVITVRLIDAVQEDVLQVAKSNFDKDNWTSQLPILLNTLFNRSNKKHNPDPVKITKSNVRELYLKGMYHWNRYTHEEMKLAIGFFKKAIKADKTYAQAYAGLADSYSVIAIMAYEKPEPNYKLAKEYVTQALFYNDKHSDSYVCAAMINTFYDKDYDKAQSNLNYALKLNPHNTKAHHFSAFNAIFTSDLELAEKHASRALKEDPISTPHYANLIRLSIYHKNFAKAFEYLEAATVIDPESLPLKELRAQINLLSGNLEVAIEEYQECLKAPNKNPLSFAFLSYTYSQAGFHHDSREIEDQLKKIREPLNTGIYDFSLGIIKLGRKDYDGFFRQANIAIKEGLTAFTGELLFNPIYSEIKKDVRYEKLMTEFGLKPEMYRSRKRVKPTSHYTILTNTSEKLTIDPQDIAYIKGEGNYCTVYWHSQNLLQHQMLRITLKQLEAQLSSHSSIIRCHKSYMININEDLKLTGNARGYFFESPFIAQRIPVSRSKSEHMKQQLSVLL